MQIVKIKEIQIGICNNNLCVKTNKILTWIRVNDVRGFFLFGGVRFWYGCPIRLAIGKAIWWIRMNRFLINLPTTKQIMNCSNQSIESYIQLKYTNKNEILFLPRCVSNWPRWWFLKFNCVYTWTSNVSDSNCWMMHDEPFIKHYTQNLKCHSTKINSHLTIPWTIL